MKLSNLLLALPIVLTGAIPAAEANTTFTLSQDKSHTIRVAYRNAVRDPNSSNRIFLEAMVKDGAGGYWQRNVHKPDELLRTQKPVWQRSWIRCDGKPSVWERGKMKYNMTKHESGVCTRFFGRYKVPETPTNERYYNAVIKRCTNFAGQDKLKYLTRLNKCLVWNGLFRVESPYHVSYLR